MIYKYINISNDMLINLVNTLLESVNEYHLFVFEKAIKFGFFNEKVIQDPEIQGEFVDLINERISGNKDKFYLIEEYKNKKIATIIEKGLERRENNEINESSCVSYFVEKIKSLVILKNAQQIVLSVRTADSNMGVGMIDEKDLTNIKSNLYSLLSDLTFDIDFGEMELEDVTKRERDKNKDNKDKIIRTFSPKLDEILVGGAAPNKLYFIAAPPGFGKSLFLCNIGKAALEQDKTVFHFTLEMSTSEVMQRYDCLISERSMIDIATQPTEQIYSYIQKFLENHKSHLLIKEFPPEMLTKDLLTLYIKRKIMSTGKKPDLIIVDYADLMKSTAKNQERRTDLGLIYRQLKALSNEFNCPVWTASQINRVGFQRTGADADISNISESWEKAMIADLVLIVRQSEEEFVRNKLRLYIGKNRSGKARSQIPCKINYAYMRIEEDEEDIENIEEVIFGQGQTIN